MRLTWSRAIVAALVVLLALVPALAPQFWVTLGNYIGLYSIVALGLVLLTGVAGQTSFGQAAFVGLGAYTTAYLTTHYGVSPWLNLAIGIAFTALVALALGFVTLRMKGHYLPLATIAWGISLSFLFGNLGFLGGHTGMTGIPALALFGYELRSERAIFYLIWLIANVRGSLPSRFPFSSAVTEATSSSLSSKPSSAKLARIRSGLTDLGMTMCPRCRCQRRIAWAGVTP